MAEIKLNEHMSISDEKISPDFHVIREEDGSWTVRDTDNRIVFHCDTRIECFMWINEPFDTTMEE